MRTDLQVGATFGRWVVVGPSDGAGWLVRCQCGYEGRRRPYKLLSGHSRSCGCLRTDASKARMTKHGGSLANAQVYKVWLALRARCRNPRDASFAGYGGRGICVDPRWDDFEAFAADMGPRPPGASVERLDNDGPYGPQNCVWASREEQNNNTRKNVWVTAGETTLTAAQWARRLGVSAGALYRFLRKSGTGPFESDDALKAALAQCFAPVQEHAQEPVTA